MTTPTILLVDDEPHILGALKRVLRDEPYNVLTADSADHALKIMADTPVSILVSDQRMPGMTGVELLKRVAETYPNTIRMMLTAHADLDIVVSAINEGKVYSFLSKPWDSENFRRTIHAAAEEHRLRTKRSGRPNTMKPETNALQEENRGETIRLRQMETRIRKFEDMKRDFAYLVVHELRTPLTCLSSCVFLLQNEAEMSEEECRTAYDLLASAVRRLDSLMNDVLSVIEEDQKRPLRSAPISINGIAGQVAAEVAIFVRARRQSLALDLAQEMPAFEGDEKKIWQVLMNLVLNAIRFTPDGGKITVATGADGGKIRIVVSDTGIGIPPEEMETIFEPFYEGRNSLHHSSGTIEFMSGSLGLGLTTARSIVERHGGKISVESIVGKGSAFTVELPPGERPNA